jgi:lipid-binding SYLF domain-containing protein
MSQEALIAPRARATGRRAARTASVAIGRVGANGRLETFDDNGVIAFALTNAGLMVGAKVDGTRISKVAS